VKAEDGNVAKRIRSRHAKDAISNRNITVAISRDESSAARSSGREGTIRKEMGLLVRSGSLGSIIEMGAKTVVVMMEQSIDRIFVEFPVKVVGMAWNLNIGNGLRRYGGIVEKTVDGRLRTGTWTWRSMCKFRVINIESRVVNKGVVHEDLIGHAGDVNIDGVDAKDIVGFEEVEEAVIISGRG
jgi:hypothetical protein